MKRNMLIIILIICFLFIAGCSDSKKTHTQESDINYLTDMQIMYHHGGANIPMTKSDTGYYYIGDDNIAIYIDKESKKATPLCSKPNCMHDDIDYCDAYLNISDNIPIDSMFGTFGTAIQYYNGHLYMVCGEYDESNIEYNTYLLRMDPDGKNRERLTDYFDCAFVDWFIHRGYFYYTSDSSINRISLNALKAKPEIIYETDNFLKDNLGTFQTLCAYKNFLYCTVDERDEEGISKGLINIYVNLDTLEMGTLPYIINNQTFFSEVMNKNLIIQYTDNDSKECIYFKSDLDGTKYTEFYRQTSVKSKYLSCDGRYVYLDNRNSVGSNETKEQIIEVYDLNMNYVDSFKLPKREGNVCNFFNPQDNDYFILEAVNNNNERVIVIADKNQIGSLNGKIIEYTELCKLDWYKEPNTAYITAE